MNILRKTYFRLLRKFYDGDVSPAEARWALDNYNHRPIFATALIMRGFGLTFGQIAEEFEDNGKRITRERVRQIVLKGVCQAEGYK